MEQLRKEIIKDRYYFKLDKFYSGQDLDELLAILERTLNNYLERVHNKDLLYLGFERSILLLNYWIDKKNNYEWIQV